MILYISVCVHILYKFLDKKIFLTRFPQNVPRVFTNRVPAKQIKFSIARNVFPRNILLKFNLVICKVWFLLKYMNIYCIELYYVIKAETLLGKDREMEKIIKFLKKMAIGLYEEI